MRRLLACGIAALCLAGCTLSQAERDCTALHATEADPLRQGAIDAGAAAATVATGLPVAPAVAAGQRAADAYCQ